MVNRAFAWRSPQSSPVSIFSDSPARTKPTQKAMKQAPA
jgi:hypothetical protein